MIFVIQYVKVGLLHDRFSFLPHYNVDKDGDGCVEIVHTLHFVLNSKTVILCKINMRHKHFLGHVLHHDLALFILPSCSEVVGDERAHHFLQVG
jgi:hypothetical protein